MEGTGSGLFRFVERVRPFLDLWGGMEIRYSAIKKSGHYYNLLSSGFLVLDSIETRAEKTLVKDGDFIAGSLKVEAPALLSIVESLGSPEIKVGEETIRLLSPSSRQPISFEEGTLERYSWNFSETNREGTYAFPPSSSGSQVFTLNAWGSSITQFTQAGEWDEIHQKLNAASYLDFSDFARDFIGWSQQVEVNSNVGFQVLAPLYSQITSLEEPKPGNLRVTIEGPVRLKPEDCRLSAVRAKDGAAALLRGEVPIRRNGTSSDPRLVAFVADVEVDDCFDTFLQLAVRAHVVDLKRWFNWTKASGNPVYSFLFSLEEAEARLRRILDGKEPKLAENSKLDVAAAWVLSTCGFVTLLTDLVGMKTVLKGQDAPDLLATFIGGRKAMVIESTTGPINEDDKLSKLSRRAERIRAARSDYEVLGVVLGAGGTATSEELNVARSLGLAVIGLGDLNDFLWLAKQVTPTQTIFERIRGKIPK